MPRAILDESHIHPAVRERVASHHRDAVQQVQDAVASHAVVVVGMRHNPYPRKARKALQAAGIAHEYLEYGSYFSDWRRRNALKMWSGWPTFPQVFVKGVLIGGFNETKAAIDDGSLKRWVDEGPPRA